MHGGMHVTAYHGPHFHSHILAVCYHSKYFDVLFSDNFEGSGGCFLLSPGTAKVLFKTPCVDGLYAVDLEKIAEEDAKHSMTAAASVSKAMEWHKTKWLSFLS